MMAQIAFWRYRARGLFQNIKTKTGSQLCARFEKDWDQLILVRLILQPTTIKPSRLHFAVVKTSREKPRFFHGIKHQMFWNAGELIKWLKSFLNCASAQLLFCCFLFYYAVSMIHHHPFAGVLNRTERFCFVLSKYFEQE